MTTAMKLARYGAPGSERPALVDAAGALRDISSFVPDIDPGTLSPDLLVRLRALDAARLAPVDPAVRLGPPVGKIGKFIGIGLNYRDHALEAGLPVPTEPVIFSKAVSCIAGPDDEVMRPYESTRIDWEVELGVVIARRSAHLEPAQAAEAIAGFCVVNDISERLFQIERSGGQWDKGKGFDTFGPIGPWLVTPDELPDPLHLDLWLDVNGEPAQRGNTRTMIFDWVHLVCYVSRFFTLMPGDVITTGTPPGVGMGRKPPRYLADGDVMTLGIQGLGRQRQTVVPLHRT
jgi:2-keto-4-pentenoate hydratase/2-oxohepta-3-ene-1,7-dioic acid hydratase in catechol pathway